MRASNSLSYNLWLLLVTEVYWSAPYSFFKALSASAGPFLSEPVHGLFSFCNSLCQTGHGSGRALERTFPTYRTPNLHYSQSKCLPNSNQGWNTIKLFFFELLFSDTHGYDMIEKRTEKAATSLGSISLALSCPVYVPPRKEEERGLLSRKAAGNRAYDYLRVSWPGAGGRGQLRLRCHAIARPMILAIMTSLVSRPVKFQWPLKNDTRQVFHPMIA